MGNNKKIAVNSIVILIRLIVTTIVGLITARFVIQALGASDYGLYSVVGGVVALLNVLNTSMTTSTYRFIAFELGKGESGNPCRVFNTSLVIHIFLSLFIIIVGGLLGLWYINNYLNISNGNIEGAIFVFWVSIITTAFSTLTVPFQGLLVAFENFIYIAIADIITKVVLLGAIVLLSSKQLLHIETYSLVMLTITLIYGFSYIVYSYRHYLSIVRLKFVKEWSSYKEMLSFTVWILFGGIGNIGQVQGSVMLVNYFFGTIVNAPFALANQIKSFINSFSTTLCQAAVPQITKEYSVGNIQQSVNLTCSMSKYTFLLMLLPVFPLFLEMDFVLELWLKEVPEGTDVFTKLTLLEGLIWCLGAGIPTLINANGNIKNYQIVAYTLLILGLPISFIFYRMGYSAYVLCVVYCILTFIISFVKLYYVKKLLNVDIRIFFKKSYTRIAYVSLPLILAYFLYSPINDTIIGHISGLVLSELFLLVIVYFVGLERKERELVLNYIKKYTSRLS